jgi:hypothetical protein
VEGGGRASSPGHEKRWLMLLGGIVRVIFELETQWPPYLGTKKPKVIKS